MSPLKQKTPWEESAPPTDDDAPLYLTGDTHEDRLAALRALQERGSGQGAIPLADDGEAHEDSAQNPFAPLPLKDLPLIEIRAGDRLWGDIVTRGCVTLFSGVPGIGKSTFIRYLVAAIAAGRTYLGRQTAPQGTPVLLIDYETPDAFRRVFWRDVYGDRIDEVANVFLASATPAINLVGAAAVVAASKAVGAGLVVIDTISAAFLVEDENRNSEMEGVMRLLREIAKPGIAVLVIVHPSKQGSDIRGASAIQGAAETIVTYKVIGEAPAEGLDESTRFLLCTRKNRVGDIGSIEIQWDGAGGFMAPTAPTEGELSNSESVVESIILAARPGTVRLQTIVEAAKAQGVTKRTAQWALKRLATKNRVRKVDHGVYG